MPKLILIGVLAIFSTNAWADIWKMPDPIEDKKAFAAKLKTLSEYCDKRPADKVQECKKRLFTEYVKATREAQNKFIEKQGLKQ